MYTIIDIETTGGSATRDRITEVAVIRHDGEKIVDEWSSLVNPECSIPPMITNLTGITNDMVRDAPKFFEIAKKLVELTQGAVFVAHNVRFDYGFIQEEFNRLGYRFVRRQLCTVRLSRKFMPQLKRHNLDTLIQHFGIVVPPNQRHRALGDTRATTIVFEHFLKEDPKFNIIRPMLNGGINESMLPPHLKIEKLHELPESCGVYYFHNEHGHVTYIGKSTNIKKRAFEHFANKAAKARQMCDTVHDITFEVTGSELASLLLEDHEIKKIKPEYNRAQRAKDAPYGIYSAENENGYHTFFIDEARNQPKRQAYMTFASGPEANMKLLEAVKMYRLCLRMCNMETRKGACRNHFMGLCDGACLGDENVEGYNNKVSKAQEFLGSDFSKDMIIIDPRGPQHSQKTFIVVQQGQLKGFGVFGYDEEGLSVEELLERVRPCSHSRESAQAIRLHLNKSSELKVIAISGR